VQPGTGRHVHDPSSSFASGLKFVAELQKDEDFFRQQEENLNAAMEDARSDLRVLLDFLRRYFWIF